MARMRLLISDFLISFMWVWSEVLAKIFAVDVLGMGHDVKGETVKCTISIINMFVFAYLGKVTNGGTYNSLTILSDAITGDFSRFLFIVGARIPSQVVGSMTGVKLILQTFPEIEQGPQLNVDIHRGALIEGLLAFIIIFISLGLSKNMPGSFFTKTWITSVSKLTLHILGSDLTGGCMNPASVMGWAQSRGDQFSKEHLLVYWLAPIEATLLAVWIVRLLVQPLKDVNRSPKAKKSD